MSMPIATALVIKQPYILCLAFIALSFFRLHEAFPQLYDLHLPLTLALASYLLKLVVLQLRKSVQPPHPKDRLLF